MVGTAGLLDGTEDATLERVSDFYTGDLRITPVDTGAIPAGWFTLDAASGQAGADDELRARGITVSARVEAQFIMSRQGLTATVFDAYGNEGQVPIETPGQNGKDANRTLAVGGLVGIETNDPSLLSMSQHIVAGRMPRPTTDGTVEVAMSVSRLRNFLTPDERAALREPPPITTLCHRGGLVRSTSCEITSAQTASNAQAAGLFVTRPVDIVGLFDTGLDLLDDSTLIAAAPQVRELLGFSANAALANVLVVTAGNTDAARDVAAQHGWATEDTASFAARYVGQLMVVLAAVVFVVGALLFLLPTFLVSHGIARQIALQQRELAVCTAIGVPASTLRTALALQVVRIAAIGAGIATLVSAVAAILLPPLLANVKGTPLPLGFNLTLTTMLGALLVTILSMAIGWTMGLRGRSKLPLTTQLRAA